MDPYRIRVQIRSTTCEAVMRIRAVFFGFGFGFDMTAKRRIRIRIQIRIRIRPYLV
jgi:hypothetical protein